MTIQVTNDVRIKREPMHKKAIYESWIVQIYDFGFGWRNQGSIRYTSQHEAETAARYYANQG